MSGRSHKQALPAGFRLGNCRVVRVLGVGGFGVTYLSEHAGLGVQVAVKEYLPNEIAVRDGVAVHPKSIRDGEGFEWGLSRFLDEARTLARFEHPNVVRVRDCFKANNTAYIVMDYEDGESLDRLLQRLGTLTEPQLKRVVLPVAEGLRQVHAAGFLHRDVKPSNIFVRRSDESPVLLDFGSARQALGRKSRSMTAIASAGYSPPEQYERHGVHGAWTDIYALAALCHRAITGEAPVEAPRRTGDLARLRGDPQASLAAAGVAGYSSGFLEAVDWGLRLIEVERPQNLDDWLARMETSPSARMAVVVETAQYVGVHTGPQEAALWFRKAAEHEFAAAQHDLAVLYDDGGGVLQDPREVAFWYGKAAAQGHAAAQNNLGAFYHKGKGVAKDARKAARWFRKAAEQGEAAAQANLGSCYYYGQGVVRDAREAARWIKKAAEQGNVAAQSDLGVMYRAGDGVPLDVGEAARWLLKAAEQGHGTAQTNLGVMYHTGQGVPKDNHEAARWFRKAAEQGDARAQINLGVLYATGEGVPKDAREAALWHVKAAEQGDPIAQVTLGFLYQNGEGVRKAADQAAHWYRKAAGQGHARAQRELGTLYAHGEGVRKDAREAARWFRQAAEKGEATAQLKLGVAYKEGDGVPKDAGKAVFWFRKAAEQGEPDAQAVLGLLYATGDGVTHDVVKAYAWLNLAAAAGDAGAAQACASLQQDMAPAQIAEAQRLSRELARWPQSSR